MTDFTHLHIHTEYSLLDGACRIKELVKRCKELGMKSIAITDHGAMYGCVDFAEACKKEGINGIIGCEVYVAPRSRFQKDHILDRQRYHLVLLAENQTGYQNLIKIVSAGWVDGFYTKMRIDKELLEKYHEGIICLSACLAGEIPQALLEDDAEAGYRKAKEIATWYRDLFGKDNYFLEIQDHGLAEQKATNPLIIRLARELGIGLVATNDAHYIKKEDARIQKILVCISTKHTIDEDTGMGFSTDEFYVKSGDEMASLFPDCPEAIENTNKIAERCRVEFSFGNTKLPIYEVPDNQDHFEYFSNLCYNGMTKRYGENYPPEYMDRLNYELKIIRQMGFVDYFLIVWDYINHAKSVGIPVGPGRGSGAGSIAAFTCGITDIDPMRYNLLFERFLNPERVSMPDFDIDFCFDNRGRVIEYVIERYGADHVAQIATFGTLAAKGAIRDVGRVLGMSASDVAKITKEIPGDLGITIPDALEKNKELKEMYDKNPEVKEIIDTSIKIEGMPRNTGMHACGIVICDRPVDEYVPLFTSEGKAVTQYYKGWVESLGLLKMDFLGLRTLTVIADAVDMIHKKDPSFDIENIDVDDPKVYQMLSKGGTFGVFQCESAGIRALMINMQPKNLEDIIAVIALYRPGPMDAIPQYLENRKHPDEIEYACPQLKPILEVTCGTLVYQEQLMQVFRDLAGYTMGASDLVRRAVAKKKADVLAAQREYFINGSDGTVAAPCDGCVKRGIPKEVATKIFDDMASFASYCFNKSHAAAYALVTYRTAWLRCYYPQEFMAAMLTSVLDNTDKVVGYITECQTNLGFKVLPPSVNESEEKFTVVGDNIRFGLLAIKNLGIGVITNILNERKENGPYESYYSFCRRCFGKDLNHRAIEQLIKSGAMDCFGLNRNQMLLMIDDILTSLDSEKKNKIEGQMGLFDFGSNLAASIEPTPPDVPELPDREKLAFEKLATGIYMSGHPIAEHMRLARSIGCAKTSDIKESKPDDPDAAYRDGDRVKLLCIISSVTKKINKNNQTWAILSCEDVYGSIEVLAFSKKYDQYGKYFVEDEIVELIGKVSIRDDKEASLTVDEVIPLAEIEDDGAYLENYQLPEMDYEIQTSAYSEYAEMNSDPDAEPEAYESSAAEPVTVEAAPPVPAAPAAVPKEPSKPLSSPRSHETEPARRPSVKSPEGSVKKRIFLRVPEENCVKYKRASSMCRIFDGDYALVFYYDNEQRYDFSTGIMTSADNTLILGLKRLLGDGNVVIKG